VVATDSRVVSNSSLTTSTASGDDDWEPRYNIAPLSLCRLP
jgi:hypothetical protein